MALKPTIFKIHLQIADMDRHHYADYKLTIAQHPSENDRRLMLKILAFSLFAGPSLNFAKGLCAEDEPELWAQDDSGTIIDWIELGVPTIKRLKKACCKSQRVQLLCYGENRTREWLEQNQSKLLQLKNLSILQINDDELNTLPSLLQRTMKLSFRSSR